MALYPGLDVFDAYKTKDRPPNIFDSFFPIPAQIGNIRSEDSFTIQTSWELKAPMHITKGFEETESMKKENSLVIYNRSQNTNDELKDVLHEVRIITNLDHNNILKFYENVSGENLTDVAFVFEPVQAVLSQMILDGIEKLYEPPAIKSIIRDLFTALDYLHQNKIIHRNIQPENIVLSPTGVFKVWNFRNAKKFGQKSKKLKVNEFRYQSVELLLQTENHDQSVDIWGANCIFAQLWLKNSLFPEHGREKVLTAIFKLLGFPQQKLWEEFSSFPGADELSNFGLHYKYNLLDTYFEKNCQRSVPPNAMDLMHKCFRYNPKYRPNAEQCLMHPYFFEEEEAAPLEDIMKDAALCDLVRRTRSTTRA